MRCSKAKKLISDYIDRNLKVRQNTSLEKHLDVCPDCRKLLKDFQKIANSAKEIEELAPSDKTWLKIMARLRPEEKKMLVFQPQKREKFSLLFSPPKLKYALSAAVLLVFIVCAGIVGLHYFGGKDVLSGEDLQRYTLAKLDEAEHHYQLAIKALWEAVSAQEENVDPQIAEVFKKNLELIDSSIVACRQIVLHEPGNINARKYLLAAYREKVDVLEEMMEIKETSSPKRGFKTII